MNRWFAPTFLVVVALALALRLPEPGRRPMHNDEGVNAMKFQSLWVHNNYNYDPNEFHGPALAYSTLPSAWLSASHDFNQFTEATFRRVTAGFGVGLILLLLLLAGGLGRNETFWAAAFTAISPAMVFYSRYYIHEMLLVFFTALTLAAGWRYTQKKSPAWSLLTGLGLGLMIATKETFVFAALSMFVAVVCAAGWSRWIDGEKPEIKSNLNLKHIAAALAVAVLVWLTFFSSFFTNRHGLLDSLKTYWIWIHRAGGESPHVHPWNFYFQRLIFFHEKNGPVWSEVLIVALAAIGLVAALRRRRPGQTNPALNRVIAFYTISLTLIYTMLAYKTPWCLLGFFWGMILLAGVGAAALLRARQPQWLKWMTGILLLAASAQLGWQAWRASFPLCASPQNPYAYAQTSPDILNLVEKIEAIARVSPRRFDTVIEVMAPQDDYGPLPWYLRRFNHIGFWDKLPPQPPAPMMIVSADFHAAFDERPDKTHVMAGYFQLRPRVFFELYVEINLWSDYVNTLPPQKD
jgi:uncharacterized protein (TIGR03663 family)